MLSQIPEHCRRIGAVLRLNLPLFRVNDARQIREGRLAALVCQSSAPLRVPVRLTEARHVKGERPALLGR